MSFIRRYCINPILVWGLLPATTVAQHRPELPASSYTVDRWGVDEGLPNYALTDALLTRDGYLWVASWAGIVRFDGVRFTPIADDLPNVHARTLLEDQDGAIWIGTSGAGVVRWTPDSAKYFGTAEGLADDDVLALAQATDGRIWVGTEGGLSVIDGAKITTWRSADGLPSNYVASVARRRNGAVLVATSGGVCEARADGILCDPSHQPLDARAILEDRNGRVWIGTHGSPSLVQTDAGFGAAIATPDRVFACDGPHCLASHDVSAVHEGRDGAIWVGFHGGGIDRVANGTIAHYGIADGLPRARVAALLEDGEGSLWVISENGGLSRLRPKRVRILSTADGLPVPMVTGLAQGPDGTIWAGAECGPVSQLVNGRFEQRFAEHTRDACITGILFTRDGSLWMGTKAAGLFRWDGSRVHHFGTGEGLSHLHVNSVFEDRDGVLWIGTDGGGLHTFENGHLSRAYGRDDGVATGFLVTMAQDHEGRIWIGSNANGLTVFEDGRFRTLAPEDNPPSRNISALLVDSRGDLWIGTADRGLFRRRNGRYEQFSRPQGLGDTLVALMVEDRDSNIWVSTARGIVRLERAQIDAVAEGRESRLSPVTIGRADGLLNTEGSGGGFDPSGLRARDGRLWFSTIDGIAVIDPATFRFNTVPPPLVIEGVSLDERPIALARRVASAGANGVVQVPAGTQNVEISYTGLSLLEPAEVRFRYRLVGFDQGWHDVGERRTAFYTSLPPGLYTFEVMAANNDGVWNRAPASVQLVIAPFWWERRGVQTMALGLLLLSGGYAVRFISLRRARARMVELERAHALERERSRIARDLHDDLGSRLSFIALMADAASSATARDVVSRAARDAMQTMDELVWTVNARNDTVEGFALYIERFAQEHLRAAGLRCRFRIDGDLGPREFPADSRRHLYLAFKEAITNAVKHAQASEIRIALRVAGELLVLEVADDGRGLPADGGDPTGNGFSNLRERMQACGGTLDIDSAPDRGTCLVFGVRLA